MIDPIAFSFGPLVVRWYGIAYIAGLVLAIFILSKLSQKRPVFKDKDQIYDLVFWVFLLGVILGGRLGYVLFYNLPYYLAHPGEIIAIWKGGMSFHGGLIGSALTGWLYCRKHKIDLLSVADMLVVPGSLALVFGRLANFVNRELVGRVIESDSWKWLGVNFGDGVLRWPSQLFAAGKDLLIFLILLIVFRKNPKRGTLLADFLILYGAFRFVVGFYRAPDPQIGFVLGQLTLGQILSLAVLAAGLILLIFSRQRQK